MSHAIEEHPDDVQRLLQPLEGLEERALGEHVEAFEEVHAGIRRILAGEGVSPQA